MVPPEIYLARHGQTAYNACPRFQGQLDIGLDDLGRKQAETLAQAAAERGFAALYASPLRRAQQTAEVVASYIGLPVSYDARLTETDTGRWTGRAFAEVEAEDPEAFAAYVAAQPTFRFPDGESYDEQTVRVIAALADVSEGPLPALVVSHRGAIRLALTHFRGDESLRAADVPTGALIPI